MKNKLTMRKNSRNTILVLSVCMALQMTSFVIILPLFARRFTELGAGVQALGVSEMAYAIASTLAAPFMGSLADRFGRKSFVLISLAAYVAAFSEYLLAQTAAAFILIRGLAGMFTAGLVPAVIGLTADMAPGDRKAQWMGFVNGGASFGWIAGPILGGMIYDCWGYNIALIVSIGIAVLTLLVALLGIPNRHVTSGYAGIKRQAKHSTGSIRGRGNAFLRDLRSALPKSPFAYVILLFIFFAVLFAWAFIEPRFMFYAYNDLGWSSSMLGLVMSTYGIAMMIGEFSLGGLSDRLGRKPIILMGLILFSAQFIGLAFFRNHILIALAFTIAGLGNALYDPTLSAAFLDISPEEHRSRTMGMKSMAGSAGTILGPALVALLNSSINARSIFLVAAGTVLFAMVAGLIYPERAKHLDEESELDTGAESTLSTPLLNVGTNAKAS